MTADLTIFKKIQNNIKRGNKQLQKSNQHGKNIKHVKFYPIFFNKFNQINKTN